MHRRPGTGLTPSFPSGEARDERRRVEAMLSPPNLQSHKGDEMVGKVLDEAIKMGLLIEEGDKGHQSLSLSDAAQRAFPGSVFDDVQGRLLMTSLLVCGEENRDICHLMAWLLAQDYRTLRGTQKGLEDELDRQVGSKRLEMTSDVRFVNLRYWSVYLGLAWLFRVGTTTEMMPDPTRHIEWLLPQLFDGKDSQPLQPWLEHLAQLCPMLPGGEFERTIPGLPSREDRHLRPSLGLALTRLRDRNVLKFESPSDAVLMVINDDGKALQVSRVRWLQQGERQTV